jgi:ABC transport system ATP-binding/permease protein
MAQDGGAGQRKRASIAVELLTRPRLLFLDEPTSGLDPSTSEDVLVVLRRLASRGVTVVFTTHDPAEIDACDRVVFLARDGHLAFAGTPTEARAYFEVDRVARFYRLLAGEASPEEWAARFAAALTERTPRTAAGPAAAVSEPPAGSTSRPAVPAWCPMPVRSLARLSSAGWCSPARPRR